MTLCHSTRANHLIYFLLNKNEMNKNEIEEARATLWKEFDTISDERIAFLMHTFKLIARMLIEKIEKGELV